MPRVAINIVTWNSSDYIRICLDAVMRQTFQDLAITVLDNGSTDCSLTTLAPYLDAGIRVIRNQHNAGYAGAHNQLIRATDSDYVLTLNPDVHLIPDFVKHLVARLDSVPEYGAASGQLRAIARESAEQSERGRVPSVGAPEALLTAVGPGTVVLAERERDVRLREVPVPAAVVVGPEGGFGARELDAAVAAGAVLAGLGPRILRSRTVAVAAAATVLSRTGDFA